jgi:hypothetical protein
MLISISGLTIAGSLLLTTLTATAAESCPYSTLTAEVTRARDGDTIVVGSMPLRLHGAAVTQSGANINTGVIYLDGGSAAITTSATINTIGNFSMMSLLGAPYGAGCVLAYGLVYNRALSAGEIEQNRQVLAAILTARGIALP